MYLGLFLEGAGIAAIMSSVAGMVVALTALPLYLTMASELEEQHLLRAQPASDIAWWRQRQRAIVVPVRSWVLLLALPVFVYAMVSLCTRELSIFESDLETARTLLLATAGAQGTLAILGLTAWLVTVELITSSYSAHVVPRLWNRQSLAAAGLLVGSILFDIFLVARSGTMMDGHPERTGALVDVAFLFAGVAVFVAIGFAMNGVRSTHPEQLMARLMDRLDAGWLSVVKHEFRLANDPIYPDDPLRGAETVLRGLVDRHDFGSFRLAVTVMAEKFRGAMRDEDLIAQDRYLSLHLRPLIAYIGSRKESAFLETLVAFVQAIDPPDAKVVMQQKMMIFETPPGERLLRALADTAVERACDDAASEALRLLGERARQLIPELPAEDQTSRYNPNYDYSREQTEKERHREWDNDQRIDVVTDQYVNYFEKLGRQAIDTRAERAIWTCSNALTGVVREACGLTQSRQIRRVLIIWSLGAFERIVRQMCESGRADGLYAGMLHYATESLTDDDPDAAEISDAICEALARVIVRLARAGLLGYGVLVEAAMTGLRAGAKGSGARRIVDAMGEALDELAPYQALEDIPFIIKELRGRIEQVGLQSGSKDARERAVQLRASWASRDSKASSAAPQYRKSRSNRSNGSNKSGRGPRQGLT